MFSLLKSKLLERVSAFKPGELNKYCFRGPVTGTLGLTGTRQWETLHVTFNLRNFKIKYCINLAKEMPMPYNTEKAQPL